MNRVCPSSPQAQLAGTSGTEQTEELALGIMNPDPKRVGGIHIAILVHFPIRNTVPIE